MSPNRATGALLLALIVLPLWTARAEATLQPGQLTGTVKNALNAPLPEVTITIRGPASQVARTDVDGRFDVPGLPEGTYELLATLSGFAPARRTVRLTPGKSTIVSLTMDRLGHEIPTDNTASGVRGGRASSVCATTIANSLHQKNVMRTGVPAIGNAGNKRLGPTLVAKLVRDERGNRGRIEAVELRAHESAGAESEWRSPRRLRLDCDWGRQAGVRACPNRTRSMNRRTIFPHSHASCSHP
jgi:Carboxypeptidase regulatory-like domain